MLITVIIFIFFFKSNQHKVLRHFSSQLKVANTQNKLPRLKYFSRIKYSTDLHKMDQWKTIIANSLTGNEWLGSDSEEGSSDEDDDDESDDDDDDDDESDDDDDSSEMDTE